MEEGISEARITDDEEGFRSLGMKELDSDGKHKGLYRKKEAQDDGGTIFRGKSTYCRSMGCWMI